MLRWPTIFTRSRYIFEGYSRGELDCSSIQTSKLSQNGKKHGIYLEGGRSIYMKHVDIKRSDFLGVIVGWFNLKSKI